MILSVLAALGVTLLVPSFTKAVPFLDGGMATGVPGDTVTIPFILVTQETEIGGVQFDLTFDGTSLEMFGGSSTIWCDVPPQCRIDPRFEHGIFLTGCLVNTEGQMETWRLFLLPDFTNPDFSGIIPIGGGVLGECDFRIRDTAEFGDRIPVAIDFVEVGGTGGQEDQHCSDIVTSKEPCGKTDGLVTVLDEPVPLAGRYCTEDTSEIGIHDIVGMVHRLLSQ